MYTIIHVRGSDAAEFLQGQLTQDVTRLKNDRCLPAAWCNPQGRVVMTLRVLAIDRDFALVIPQDSAESALARLRMYRLRAKVEFLPDAGDWQLFAVADGCIGTERLPADICFAQLASEDPVLEIFASRDAVGRAGLRNTPQLDTVAWQLARICAGQVDVCAANTTQYTPHMLNLDLTGAISFRKGCYTGQEIVARTENLGRSKRRTFRYSCDEPDLAIGATLRDGDQNVGTIVNVSGNALLAVVPVALAGKPLHIRGVEATPQPLPYEIPA
ncbi:MAG: hypothetical protein OEW68_01700 [Gammaproteobacteria bacterium]|nr:hypothetical protein [Gammaproteobacteria bacterium]